jgi:aldehyde oxidoreductase
MSMIRMTLNINGADRAFICNPERDTLSDVIRRIGLTGTKVGCGKGMCGSCNVILNGKLVRSCTRKISSVEGGSTVLTIEGLGTADNLHPLQLSWIVNGGVQCGFCTPGFIVSAKALLDENPSPTREDVRTWFKKNKNACRCTGYKHIVDSVMEAAKVLRGEMTMEELAYKLPEDGSVFGQSHPRPAALSKVLGTCDYGDDIACKVEDALHLAPVLPPIAHGLIKSIDYSEAEKAPGVVRIITAKDVPGINRVTFPIGSKMAIGDGFERPIIADTKVHYRGSVIALVAANTRRQARDAAKLVKVEIEPLPEYLDVLDAMADDAVEIHPGIPNTFIKNPYYRGEDTREVIPKSAHVVEGSFHTSRQPHLPIEPDVGQAYVDEDGILTVQVKTHGVYLAKFIIAPGLGLPPDKIRIIMNPTGGTFGYSISPGMAAMLGAAALVTGKLVTMTLSYAEHQYMTGKRGASYSNGKLACDENGKLTASEFHIGYDKGSFSETAGPGAKIGCRFFGVPYAIPNQRHLATATYSNTPFSTAYRCPNAPQVFMASEQLMDMLAEKAGIDPWDLRYKNAWREGDISVNGDTLDVYPVPKMLETIKPKYEALKERAKKNSTPEKPHGVGIALGLFNVGGFRDHAEVDIELNSDGSVTNFNTWEDCGQGGDVGAMAFVHEALKPIGLPAEKIKLVMNDTGTCPNSGVAGTSRSNFFNGNAIIDAANKLLDAMKKPDGSYRTYDEMVAEGIPTKYRGVYDAPPPRVPEDLNTGAGGSTPVHCYGAFAAEVAVDVATGDVEVVAMHCVAEVGKPNNPINLDGQAFGGMQHSIGYALSEDFYDMEKHTNLVGAGFRYIDGIPDGDDFTVEYTDFPRPTAPFGSSGASEAFQSSGHAAILNALYDAAGVRIYSLPARPEHVKAALEAKANGTEQPPEKYYLGMDFNETLDYCKANPIDD